MIRKFWILMLFSLVLTSSVIKAQDEGPTEGEGSAPLETVEEGSAEGEEGGSGDEVTFPDSETPEETGEGGAEADAGVEAEASVELKADSEQGVEVGANLNVGGDAEVKEGEEEEVVEEPVEEVEVSEQEYEVEDEAAEDEDEASGEGEEECEIVEDNGSGYSVEEILALGEKKCKSGAAALAEELFQCDMDGMDEKVAGCMENLDNRVKTLEQTMLSGGGGLEEQITLVLVKKGVIDCDNDTQCADDRACIDSYEEPGRLMCERPCDRHRCNVPYSKCVTTNHKPACVCKEEFHGNGSVACFPKGFEEQNNTKSYRMFDDRYVTFENASQHCQELGARLPVLDSEETIDVVKHYLETSNFSVFQEEWDRSSRRVWLGLVMDPSAGLIWADGQRVISYPSSSRLFVWEARRMLSQEVSYADNSRHYALYIDGDVAKLPGGGRRGAAVLCELVPSMIQEEPYDQYRYDQQYGQGRGDYSGYPGYPSYPYPMNSQEYPGYDDKEG